MAEQAMWYVVHTYSGYENKVASSIENAVEKGGAGITDAERATFYQVLDVISQNLQALCAEGAAETCIL